MMVENAISLILKKKKRDWKRKTRGALSPIPLGNCGSFEFLAHQAPPPFGVLSRLIIPSTELQNVTDMADISV